MIVAVQAKIATRGNVMDDKKRKRTQAECIQRKDLSARVEHIKFLKCCKCGYVLLSEERDCPHCYAGDTGSIEVVERPTDFVNEHNFREWEKLKNDG